MDYSAYQHLLTERLSNGVLKVTINRPEVMNAVNPRLHGELGRIWRDIGDDDETRVALITGAGRAFCAGGDLYGVDLKDYRVISHLHREARDVVYNMINLDKPIVSAINGWAIGVGVAVALLADISVISDKAKILDGHTRIGVTAGDHSALIWPLLCGMARAKHYLLTCDPIPGEEAARVGLVSLCVPHEELLVRATEIADRLGRGSSAALRSTKYALNNWLRMAGPTFDASLAMEMLEFYGSDVTEGLAAADQKREPHFLSRELTNH